MGFEPPRGWDRDSEDLFLHESGTRIAKTSYRGKLGWWIFPTDLDAPPLEFPPTDEGLRQAFASLPKALTRPAPVKAKVHAKVEEEEEPKRPAVAGEGEEVPAGAEGEEEAEEDEAGEEE